MVTVLIFKESRYPVSREKIRQAVEQVLTEQKVKGKIEVSVSVIGDRKMKVLKKQYLGEEGTTDVLSFPLGEVPGKFIDPPDGVLRLGDIVVSYPQAVLNAAQDNVLVDEEITALVKHGVKHLLGIHHE